MSVETISQRMDYLSALSTHFEVGERSLTSRQISYRRNLVETSTHLFRAERSQLIYFLLSGGFWNLEERSNSSN